MITKIGIEVELFFVFDEKVSCPPVEFLNDRDGSMALIEFRTDPLVDKFSMFTSIMKSVERVSALAEKLKGRGLYAVNGKMSTDEYKKCQKAINTAGEKVIHGADAYPLVGKEHFRNSTFDNKAHEWNLWAAMHVNISRSMGKTEEFVEKRCKKCGHETKRTLTATMSRLEKAWVIAYYDRLAKSLGTIGWPEIKGRMVRNKPFGVELRSIPTIPVTPGANLVWSLSEALFSFPKDELIC